MMTSISRLLTEQEVSALIAIAPKTLQRWRVEGRGPKYRKLGNAAARSSAVRYEAEAVEAWLRAQAERGGGNH